MASPGSFSAGFARENRGVCPVTAPAFFAAARRSPRLASSASCVARSSAWAVAFPRLTARATRSLISASAGTPAGIVSTALSSTSPAAVFTGGDTPPGVRLKAASSSGLGPPPPAKRPVRATLDSEAARPSSFACPVKSFAASSFGRISAARAVITFSAASASSLARICAATSFSGFLPASRTSRTLIAWKPNGVRTGSGEIAPFFNAKSACSNCGTISPRRTQPRSPPFGADPGPSKWSLPVLPNRRPPSARRMPSPPLAVAFPSPSFPPARARAPGRRRPELDQRPRRTDLLAAQDEGVLDFRGRDLHAARHEPPYPPGRQLTTHIVDVRRLANTGALEDLLEAPPREPAVFMERGLGIDLGVHLVVGRLEPFGARSLDDQGLLKDRGRHVPIRPEPLGQFGGHRLPRGLRIHIRVGLIGALVARERDRLSVDRRDGVAARAVAEPPLAEDEERGDERPDHQEEAHLETSPVPPHERDHPRALRP